jgi:formyltetrahydrofolate deformylase
LAKGKTGAIAVGVSAQFVLLITCQDRPGIVAAVAQCIANAGGNILESAQYSDEDSGRFFMRIAFAPGPDIAGFRAAFADVANGIGCDWQLHDTACKPRVAILVSQGGHCLNDLLYRTATARLPMEVTSVISNHDKWQRRVEHEGISFHYLPVTADNKASQEAELLALLDAQQVDLVILARYMQVLSDGVCERYSGRIINIHHSFLPGFKGARPYHRAHERGVKMVGATAHYVTAELDEGPIIAQDVSVVDHADSVEDLIAQGQDTESRVLARAVKAHIEHRVLLNGQRTVVFK